MPTYEYVCRSCEHRFEQWQKMTDDPLQICPQCGGHVRRVLYPAGIVFKGSGFYSTDHSASGSVSNGHEHKHEEGQKHEENGAAAKTDGGSNGTSDAAAARPPDAASAPAGEKKAAAATTTK